MFKPDTYKPGDIISTTVEIKCDVQTHSLIVKEMTSTTVEIKCDVQTGVPVEPTTHLQQ